MRCILADMDPNVLELKNSPSVVLRRIHGGKVGVLEQYGVVGRTTSSDVFEAISERLDDLRLMQIISARRHETPIPVTFDDLDV